MPLTRSPESTNDPPVHEVAEVHARIAPTDVKSIADFIHRVRFTAYKQQGVYLRHGPVDAPTTAHPSPLLEE